MVQAKEKNVTVSGEMNTITTLMDGIGAMLNCTYKTPHLLLYMLGTRKNGVHIYVENNREMNPLGVRGNRSVGKLLLERAGRTVSSAAGSK